MTEPVESLVIAACLGALTGLIRQWEVQQEAETGSAADFAGLRSFTLVALWGCLAAHLSNTRVPAAFAVSLGALGVLLGATQFARVREASHGFTTPIAAVLTFLTGALVFWQERQAAVLVAALTMILVGLKQPIHQWTRRFTVQDLRSTLQFVAITGVILPLVPNRTLDPYGAFNPRATWLMVVLISGIGFLGFLLMRLLGPRAGIALTGLVGGLASSTATTLAFSRRSRENPAESDTCALAVVLACNVMIVRVLVVVAALHPPAARTLALPLLVMGIPGLAYAVRTLWRPHPASEPIESPRVGNPLSLATAVKFALLYAAVKFLVKLVTASGADRGLLVVSGIAGLTDVDAIAISLSEGAREGSLALSVAGAGITVACIVNTLVKAAIAAALGSAAYRTWILRILGATAAAGVAGWFFLGTAR